MKISKSLLKAIFVGATISTSVSACETLQENERIQDCQCTEVCSEDCSERNETYEDCPTCGLG